MKPATLRIILLAGTGVLVLAGTLILVEFGSTALLIFSMFASVIAAAALVLDTKLKGKFQNRAGDGGWWTGIVVGERKVKIKVDWNSCMGAASCVELAPKVFRLDWEKKKSVFDPAPLQLLNEKGDVPEKIFFAAQSCPYHAIILEDEETGERIFP